MQNVPLCFGTFFSSSIILITAERVQISTHYQTQCIIDWLGLKLSAFIIIIGDLINTCVCVKHVNKYITWLHGE